MNSLPIKPAPMVTVAFGCCGPSNESGSTLDDGEPTFMRFRPTVSVVQMTQPPAPRLAPVAAAVALACR